MMEASNHPTLVLFLSLLRYRVNVTSSGMCGIFSSFIQQLSCNGATSKIHMKDGHINVYMYIQCIMLS